MDYTFAASPPFSSENSHFPFGVEVAESASDLSSPTSPNGISHPMCTYTESPYDMLSVGNPPTPYCDPMAGKIPVEYIGSTSLDGHDGRRSKSKDKEKVSSMHLRRRAQNRASQRAFRERKERHLKGLESKLQDLHSKHQNLLQSYHQQTEEVQQLNIRIQQLTAELDLLRSATDGTIGEILMPDKFDVVPYPMLAASGPQHHCEEAFKINSDLMAYPPEYYDRL
ncbi:predicted protein [Histoplasma capsulatum G186AR]|uniref:Putative transcription factor kapC n=2 Tax=Ajellomyces capsulatus TaxID=5037 RepID=C0NI05_AJECG|nr:uncharacterized protein HCBG_02977 [Histoplasma capsulatum G186AR]EEH09440.1 predicted protein [Histoplasma capsulatum G186AR]KAG5303226.1 putative bZIP transcription factor [Histoplasma capsulatum]QSS68824.1 bZIP transcription factor, putative [Histoplasma capsulatum G186AR]